MPRPTVWPVPSVLDTFATVTNLTGVILAANPNRLEVDITNDSDVVVYLARGGAAVIGSGHRLNARGGEYRIGTENMWLGEISAICATDANLAISEGYGP